METKPLESTWSAGPLGRVVEVQELPAGANIDEGALVPPKQPPREWLCCSFPLPCEQLGVLTLPPARVGSRAWQVPCVCSLPVML